jgi:hypothetical protein
VKLTDQRAELPLGEPPLHIRFSEKAPASRSWGPGWLTKYEEQISTVHVMSRAVGGEVRGYWSLRGALWLRFPVSPIEWDEVDLLVASALKLDVFSRTRGINGEWSEVTLATASMAAAVNEVTR